MESLPSITFRSPVKVLKSEPHGFRPYLVCFFSPLSEKTGVYTFDHDRNPSAYGGGPPPMAGEFPFARRRDTHRITLLLRRTPLETGSLPLHY